MGTPFQAKSYEFTQYTSAQTGLAANGGRAKHRKTRSHQPALWQVHGPSVHVGADDVAKAVAAAK